MNQSMKQINFPIYVGDDDGDWCFTATFVPMVG